jgi:hypothetical protein
MTCLSKVPWPRLAAAADRLSRDTLSNPSRQCLIATLHGPIRGLSTLGQMLKGPLYPTSVAAPAYHQSPHHLQPHIHVHANRLPLCSRLKGLSELFSSRHQHAHVWASALHSLSAAQPPASKGQNLMEVDTPALLVDLDGKHVF